MSATPPTFAEFEAALPEGWECEILQNHYEQWEVWAYHAFYPNVQIGPKLKLVPADVGFLRSRVDDVIAPEMTYSQWLAAGERYGVAVKPWQVGGCLALVAAGLCLLTGFVQLPSKLCVLVMLPSLLLSGLFCRRSAPTSFGWDVVWAAGIAATGCLLLCAAQMISQPYDTRDTRHVDASQVWATVVGVSLLFGRWRNAS